MKTGIGMLLLAGIAILAIELPSGAQTPAEKELSGRRPVEHLDVESRKESSMGQFVIVCYRPKAGKDAQLLELVRNHMTVLLKEGLVTERPAYAMRAADGTIVEVFEWKSAKAVESAHTNKAVQAMWQRFGEACDYEAIGNLAEAKQLFSAFTPIDFR